MYYGLFSFCVWLRPRKKSTPSKWGLLVPIISYEVYYTVPSGGFQDPRGLVGTSYSNVDVFLIRLPANILISIVGLLTCISNLVDMIVFAYSPPITSCVQGTSLHDSIDDGNLQRGGRVIVYSVFNSIVNDLVVHRIDAILALVPSVVLEDDLIGVPATLINYICVITKDVYSLLVSIVS